MGKLLGRTTVCAATAASVALAPAFARAQASPLPPLPPPPGESRSPDASSPPAEPPPTPMPTSVPEASGQTTDDVPRDDAITSGATNRVGDAPDRARQVALIVSPIVLGVGGTVSGAAYLFQKENERAAAGQPCHNTLQGTSCVDSSVPELVIYDSIVAIVPSVPRWVVGDVRGALVYTGLRGASVIAASVINWGDPATSRSVIGPFIFGFVVPIALGIVDLATTPHRDDLTTSSKPEEAHGPSISSIAPVALIGPERRVNGAVVTLRANF